MDRKTNKEMTEVRVLVRKIVRRWDKRIGRWEKFFREDYPAYCATRQKQDKKREPWMDAW